MNILVTGGCGFIGSHFLRELYKNTTNNLINLDKLTYAGNIENINDLGIETIVSDISNADTVSRILKDYKIDAVINFAATTHVDRSIKNPSEFIETDILGLFNLVKTCLDNQVKRFLQVSTDECYGPAVDFNTGRKINKVEEDILNPTSPYSASKAAADLLLLAYYKTYNFPAVIVRPCNNYGTHQYPEKLIPMAITRLLDDKKVLLHGRGEEIREWIHVKDCVKLIHRVLRCGNVGEIYNIGSGIRYSNYIIVSNLINLIHNCRGCNTEKWIERVPNRPGNDSIYALNSDKLLHQYPIHFKNMKEGLKETIEWYKNNENWWEDIDIESNIHTDEYLR